MKKLLLLILGVVSFMCASAADVYLRGDWHNNWGTDDGNKMTLSDGFLYTLSNVNMAQGQTFKIGGSDWGSINYGSGDDGSYSANIGVTKTLEYNKGHLKAAQAFNNVTVTFNMENKELKIFASPYKRSYQLHTNLLGEWSDYDMTEDANGNYVYTFTNVERSSSNRELGMKIDNSWRGSSSSSVFTGDNVVEFSMDKTSDGNIQISKDFEGEITCSYNPKNNILTFEKATELPLQIFFPYKDINGRQEYSFNSNNIATVSIPTPLNDNVKLFVRKEVGANDYQRYSGGLLYPVDSEQDPNGPNNNEPTLTYIPTVNGATATLVATQTDAEYIILPKGLKGTITFKVETDAEQNPTRLTITGGEKVEGWNYSYKLWDNFANGEATLEQRAEFEPVADHYVAKYTFTGEEENDLCFKVERFLNGKTVTGRRWGIMRNSEAYVPNHMQGKVYDQLSANGTRNIVLPKGIRGTVYFSLYVDDQGVPEKFIIRGGRMDAGPDEMYTIFFYDTDGTHLNPAAYIWNGSNQFTSLTDASDKSLMNFTGKYIHKDNKYYPVYQLTFDCLFEPKNVIIHEWKKDNQYTSGNPLFVNAGIYYPGCTQAEPAGTYQLVDDPNSATFYMHWKENWEQHSDGQLPRCYLSTSSDPIDSYNHDNNNNLWNVAKVMERITEKAPNIATNPYGEVSTDNQLTITEKYQLWQVHFTGEEMKNVKNVVFMYRNAENNGQDNAGKIEAFPTTAKDNNGRTYEAGTLTKYIYAPAKDVKNYAEQTFLTFEQFKKKDREGRNSVYVVGEGSIQGLKWEPINAAKFDAEKEGCFYIQLTTGDAQKTKFKMSWISVAEAAKGFSEAEKNDGMRQWATYDLGIFGVNTDKNIYPASFSLPAPFLDGGNDGTYSVSFQVNQSIGYKNYNQYNWYLYEKDIEPLLTNNGIAYIVVDPHSTCRTVSLIPYDPNPSISGKSSGFDVLDLDTAQAEMFHGNHTHHMNASAHNGHIYMNQLNKLSGTIDIHKSHQDLTNNFDLMYSIYMNQDEVIRHSNPDAQIALEYMPLAASNGIGVRCEYTSKATNLKFHSRLGTGSIETPDITILTPKEVNFKASKVKDPGTESNPGMQGNIGILAKGIKFEFPEGESTPLAYFADFDFTQGDRAEIIHSDHRLISKKYGTPLAGWTFLNPDNNYTSDNDWSTIIKNGAPADIYLTNTGSDVSAVDGTIYAVYPFIYEDTTNAAVASAPRKVASTIPDEDITSGKYKITYMRMSAPMKSNGTITSIDTIEVADADLTDAEAEYYTISGVRVYGEPAPGIYICRKGNTAKKVVVR